MKFNHILVLNLVFILSLVYCVEACCDCYSKDGLSTWIACEDLGPGDDGYYDQPVENLDFNAKGFSIADLRAVNPSWVYSESGSLSKDQMTAIAGNSELLAQLEPGEIGSLIINGKKDFVDAMSDKDATKHFEDLKQYGGLDHLGVDRWLGNDELLGLVTDFVCHDIPRSRVQIP